MTIKNVTVIGGGLMGAGIAQVCAHSGLKITVVDVTQKALENTLKMIEDSTIRVIKKKFKDNKQDGDKLLMVTKENINTSTDAETAVLDSQLVIEAIVENLEAKQQLFGILDKKAPKETIFASNTSSLSIAAIASQTQRKDRFGGLHFFNPVPVMKLLEVIRIPETSNSTYSALLDFGNHIGKTCVTCKDTPGFIVNRLLIPYTSEAIKMYERGDASFEDIDNAMKLGAGYPMGPFELMDITGIDTGNRIRQGWQQHYPHLGIKVSSTVERLIKEGRLGRKTGKGFYEYK